MFALSLETLERMTTEVHHPRLAPHDGAPASEPPPEPPSGETDGLHALLKMQTLASHQRLDDAVRHALVEKAGYVAFLRGAFEAIAAASPALVRFGVASEEEMARRTAALTEDLASLGAAPLTPALGLDAPDSIEEAWGAAYVIEGSALGGRVLSKAAARMLGIPAASRAYLDLHGDETAARFRAFVDRMDAWDAGSGPRARADAARGAEAMFARYAAAFRAAGIAIGDDA